MKALRFLMGLLAMYVMPNTLPLAAESARRRSFHRSDGAFVDFTAIASTAGAIILLLVLGAVGLKVAAALLPTYSSATKDLASNFSTADWGDPLANDLGPIFSMVIALSGMLGFVAIVLGVIYLAFKGGGRGRGIHVGA